MRLLYGTGNRAKMEYMRKVLRELDIQVVGMGEAGYDVPEVAERGNDPLTNACLKARAYYEVSGEPVFSCDSGLYIEGLPEERQPGVNVRTVGGRRMSDEEMIAHYAALADELGGAARARYINAVCLVMDGDTVITYDGVDIASEWFLLTNRPHDKRNPGFPLDSISLEIRTGHYYFDLNHQGHIDTDHTEEEGFRNFFRRVLAC